MLSQLEQLKKEIETKHSRLLKVSKKLSKPHPLIYKKLKYWEESKKDRSHNFRENPLLIRVTEKNELRALRFMDALIKLLEARGHSIKKKNYETVAVVFDIQIEIYLREANKRIPSNEKYGTADYIPTGILVLKINRWYREKEWKDGKTQTIEDRLSEIVARLEIDALEEIEQNKRHELDRIRYEEEKLLKEKELALIIAEKEKTVNLIKDSKDYIKALNIRRFIEELENKVKNSPKYYEEYIKWAKAKADWIDPLTETEDKILGIYNRKDFQDE